MNLTNRLDMRREQICFNRKGVDMKLINSFLFATGMIFLSNLGHASQCPVPADVDAIGQAIKQAQTCYAASRIAEDCSYGSSVDSFFVGLAVDICLAETTATEAQKEAILLPLVQGCTDKYEGMQGTVYISARAFCALNAYKALASSF